MVSLIVVTSLDMFSSSPVRMENYLLNEECNKKVSDAHLERLSSKCCDEWRNLTSHLEMDSIVKRDIDRKCVSERQKRLDYFTEWKDQKGSAATYKSLIRALLKIDCWDDAEYVYQMSQSSGSQSTSPALTTSDIAEVTSCSPPQAMSGTLTAKGQCFHVCRKRGGGGGGGGNCFVKGHSGRLANPQCFQLSDQIILVWACRKN